MANREANIFKRQEVTLRYCAAGVDHKFPRHTTRFIACAIARTV